MRATLTSLVCSLALASAAWADANVCPIVQAAFKSGCYTGDGTSGRVITTGISNPGLLIVSQLSNQPNASQWHTPDMPAATSCGMANGTPQCPTNAVTAVDGCGFTVDTGLNNNAQTFCWYEAQRGATHETFSYLGSGSSPRTIGLPFTPDFCALQTAQNNALDFANSFYVRTNDMPVNTSYPFSSGLNSTATDVITSLTSNGVVVGAGANENNKRYRGFCFAAAANYGQKIFYQGNGTSSGGGQCATAGNVQTISTTSGGPVQMVFVAGCTIALTTGCDGTTCTQHIGVQGGWRATNIGTGVVGPGHVTSDFYEQSVTQPDVSELGGFSDNDNTFLVRGTNFAGASLNDNGANIYGFAITAPTPSLPPGCPTPTP